MIGYLLSLFMLSPSTEKKETAKRKKIANKFISKFLKRTINIF